MGEAFVKIDLHGLHQDEAMKVIDKAISSADKGTYQIHLIHGYNRGTNLRTMIPGDNPGITVLVMRELY